MIDYKLKEFYFAVAMGLVVAAVMLLLGGCAAPPVIVEVTREVVVTSTYDAVDNMYATVAALDCEYWAIQGENGTECVTATPVPSNTPTITPTAACPPRVFDSLTVGYIPGLDLGGKQSPVVVDYGCYALSITGEGWAINGILAEDGFSLASCMFSADKDYACHLYFRNLETMNVDVGYTDKVGRDYPICLAADRLDFRGECGG